MDEDYPCLKADHVLTFEIPKTGLLFPTSQKWLNDFSIVKIELDKNIRESFDSFYYFIEKRMMKKLLKPASKFSHKGSFGHVLIMGGSYGKIGATVLSSLAALKQAVALLLPIYPNAVTILCKTV